MPKNRLDIDEDCDCAHALRAKWRPIAEIHEDYCPCVAIDIHDPGNVAVVDIRDEDYDDSDWTHFALLPLLTNEMAEAMVEGTPHDSASKA